MQSSNEFTLNFVLSGQWWEVLGVAQGAHPKNVKLAYRRLARQYHPDVNSAVNAKHYMQAINQAYQEFLKQLNSYFAKQA